MSKILAIKARQILDSRGNPTVECDIKTDKGIFRASSPSGASTGTNEALELRDNKKAYHGKSVQIAVKNVNLILAKKLKGKNVAKQQDLDNLMIKIDGTKNKSKLGANAILAVSMAIARAGAASKELPLYEHLSKLHGTKLTLPVPAFNIINGGKHAGGKLDIQEYQILPVGAKSFSEALQIGTEIYQTLKKNLENDFGKAAINVGDEGGFAPPLTCMDEPFDYITNTIIKLGYWKKVKLGIDAAATEFWKHGTYYIEGKEYSPEQLKERYEQMVDDYPLVSIEDPFYEEGFDEFAQLSKEIDAQIIGDDLTVTNPERIKKAIQQKSCNCLLLKVNQIGTITEAMKAAKIAAEAGWNIQASHRSGETTDTFVADLAVGLSTGQIKSGAPCRGERTAKYNQLLRIEEELGRKAKYAKVKFT